MVEQQPIQTFPDLSPQAFQHPLDAQATGTLQTVEVLPKLVRFVSEKGIERIQHIHHSSSAIRVSENQYPRLYRFYVQMANVLDVRKLPHLYIATDGTINAFASGMENYTIVLCSGLVDLLTEKELVAVLGHELGHVKCDHQVYKTLAYLLAEFGAPLIEQIVPIGAKTARMALETALLDWNRKAEFSCDRAALLATQDEEAVCSALAKLAGFSPALNEPINIEAVIGQAEDFEDIGANSLINRVIKLHLLSKQTHPHPVVRVKEIRSWARSEEYRQILKGNYRRLTPKQIGNGAAQPLATPRGLVCPQCTTVVPSGAVFCPKCAANLREALLVCGGCRAAIQPAWINCPGCGHQLQPRLLTS